MPTSPVRSALLLDAAFELVGAAMMVVAGGTFADLLNVNRIVLWIAAGVFLAAGIGIAAAVNADFESRELVWSLAVANIAGGVVLWVLLGVAWGHFEAGGRWLLGAVADMFILVGVLEIVALRRTPVRE
ncbi:MAG TPA: hypothetical protein VFY90_05345 [Tepidiformaceae bacterium]|nr:hypothetical protein [Tepidiformaceae bacterium]